MLPNAIVHGVEGSTLTLEYKNTEFHIEKSSGRNNLHIIRVRVEYSTIFCGGSTRHDTTRQRPYAIVQLQYSPSDIDSDATRRDACAVQRMADAMGVVACAALSVRCCCCGAHLSPQQHLYTTPHNVQYTATRRDGNCVSTVRGGRGAERRDAEG